jgi:hypothetical protein
LSFVYATLGREVDRQAELALVFGLGADEGPVIPRAERLGRQGRWAEAAGDRAGYREACAAFLAGQGPDPTVVWNALSAASLLALAPAATDDYRVPIASLEKRLSAAPAPPPLYRHLYSNALGGLLLRAGRIDEAVARLNEGTAVANELEIPADRTYLALAHARQGRFGGARLWLDRLRGVQPDPRGSFWDLQELDLLRTEAESLLSDAGFPGDPFQGPRPTP